jgi:uncharacterized protein YciW
MKNNVLRSPPLVPPASRDQVEKFLKGLQQFRSRGFSPRSKRIRPADEIEVKKYDQAAVKKYLDEMTAGMQQSIAQRIIMDILKSPMPDAGDQRKRTAKRKTSKKKPARGYKSKRPSSKALKARKRK